MAGIVSLSVALPLSTKLDSLTPPAPWQWVIDVVQNVFNAVNSRRGGSRGGDYNYNYNYEPAPVAPPQRANTGPDYSSPAWQASSAAASGDAAAPPPAPPAKSTSTREPHNPLAGGGSLLEDEEDEDEDEAALAMPGTQQQQNGNGKSAGSLV